MVVGPFSPATRRPVAAVSGLAASSWAAARGRRSGLRRGSLGRSCGRGRGRAAARQRDTQGRRSDGRPNTLTIDHASSSLLHLRPHYTIMLINCLLPRQQSFGRPPMDYIPYYDVLRRTSLFHNMPDRDLDTLMASFAPLCAAGMTGENCCSWPVTPPGRWASSWRARSWPPSPCRTVPRWSWPTWARAACSPMCWQAARAKVPSM